MRRVPNSFFKKKTLSIARELLGKYLVRRYYSPTHKRYILAREKITEVEAYIGPHDLACHSAKGRTARTDVMFQEAGTIYVYFIYGMYWMLNIVTEEQGYPAAILIRGTESFKGPGILTRELKIDKSLNGRKLGVESGLWIEEDLKIGNRKMKIELTPRIGVSYAPEPWCSAPYRFLLKN